MSGNWTPWLTVFTCLLSYVSKQKNSSDLEIFKFPDPSINETYDFIIIGAGSAGSVVANRLSEVKEWRILLVEAGGEEDIISDTPILAPILGRTEKNWNLTTVKQNHACRSSEGICPYLQAHALGGGSTLNYMHYVRGNKYDFDNWKNQGNEEWGYENVLPYFLKSEDIRIKELSDSKYHSKGGFLQVDKNARRSSIQEDIIKAGEELGYHSGDYNGETQNGISYLQYTIRNGTRCSTAKAFLHDIKNRPNIHIVKRALAVKINLNSNNSKAEGVTLIKDGKTLNVKVEKEVILSAGGVYSPKLLMLSGIGPKEHLIDVGITPKVELPVGFNLHDHAMVFTYFKINESITPTMNKIQNIDNILVYAKDKKGILSTSPCDIVGFLPLKDDPDDLPDIQLFFCTVNFFGDQPMLLASASKLRPYNDGTVRLKSSNPLDQPLVDPKFLEDPKDFDDTVKGCMIILELMKSKALSKYNPRINTDGTLCEEKKGEEYCKCVVLNHSSSMFHPSGTARMGKDGVVNQNLIVRGVSNLRVVDASIMPNVTSGNTNAPTIMIGEKASDIIKRFWMIS